MIGNKMRKLPRDIDTGFSAPIPTENYKKI